MTYVIAPSLLSADMTRLGDEAFAVMEAGADMIHFDVMDNHYVPNLTFGPPVCKALYQRFPNYLLDVHLMVCPVDELVVQFAEAGAKRISIHPEATTHLDRSLQLIQQQGCKAGLVLNPATSIDYLRWVAHRLHFVLVMTVNPGFGGQRLIPEILDKIKRIKLEYPTLAICVDGGVSIDNIAHLAKAGATEFVAGTAIFSTADYAKTIKNMREELARVR